MKKRLISLFFVFALSFSLSLSVSAEFVASDSTNLSRIVTELTNSSSSYIKGMIATIYDQLRVKANGNIYAFISSIADNTNSANGYLNTISDYVSSLTRAPSDYSNSSIVGLLHSISSSGSSLVTKADSLYSQQGSILSEVSGFDKPLGEIASSTGDTMRNTNVLVNDLRSSNNLLSAIDDSVGLLATEATLSGFTSVFLNSSTLSSTRDESHPLLLGHDPGTPSRLFGSYKSWFELIFQNLTRDAYYPPFTFGEQLPPTIYSMVKRLQETLASDDDVQIAQNQQENRDQIKSDFLSGQTGSTSLGKGDFNNASQVGGALNDTFNMGGASKVSDFLSGFGSAGEESLSWFSDTTANNLDGVTAAGKSSSGVSTFADDGETMVDVDSDPYNMAAIFDRYEWLEGVLG